MLVGKQKQNVQKPKCHERGEKKKFESPLGFEPMTSQTLGGHSIHLSYGELMESEAIY